jgi:CHAT domain-containing protein/Tfp pilus assembly protein PilF
VNKRPRLLAIGILVALAHGSGCRASPSPEQAFAEAEGLRLKYERGASQQAIAKYQVALVGWTRQGNNRDAAKAGQHLAGTYEQLGALKESMQRYVQALALTKTIRDPLLESDVRSDVGMAHARLGEFDQALSHCREALNLADRARGVRETAQALNCLGEVDYHRGNSQGALVYYRRAERLWSGLEDRRGRAETLLFLGSAHTDLNELDDAGRYLKLSLPLWTELGDKRGQALTDLALTRLLYFPGEYQEALNRLTGLRDQFQAAGDAVGEATCLSNIAYVYEQMGEGRNALRYWEGASDLFGAAGLQMAALEMFVRIGTSYLASDVSTALSWFEKARTLSEASGNQHMQSWALRYIGVAHLARGDPTKALGYLERSLDIQRSVEDPRFRGRTLADVGKAHNLLGDHRRASAHFNQALALSQASRDRVGEAMALFGLARTSAGLNDLDRARAYIESALNKAESLRTEVENRDLRASYFASIHQYHELYLDVLMRLNKAHPEKHLAAAAFGASERARARSLLDSLTEARVDFRKGMDAELLKREQVVQKGFDDWAERQRRVGSSSPPTTDEKALAAEYRSLEDRYNLLRAEIRSKSPHFAALAQPRPLTLIEVQKQVLDAGTLLLEFALGEERSYLWAVSNRDQSSYELPPRAKIEQAAERVYRLLTARLTVTGDQQTRRRRVEEADTEYWQEAARLSEMLLGPVAERMAGKRLLLVTDGALQYLPFAALPVPGTRVSPVPMVVEHELVNVPSASVLAVLRRESAGNALPAGTVAVLADPVFDRDDPRLPSAGAARQLRKQTSATANLGELGAAANEALRGVGFTRDGTLTIPRLIATRQEADDIVATASEGMTLKAIDFDASRATAMGPQLPQYRIVHFATHGVFNNEDPGLSGIILSMFDERGQAQDGFLRLHDIYGLRLPAELVVLSACNTALGKPVKGEGLVGMVRGFIYAGAKRVVASYWKVDDEATGELMRRFYQEMLKQDRSPAASLRQAQLAMRQHDRWQPPFYWAAFSLQGEWK